MMQSDAKIVEAAPQVAREKQLVVPKAVDPRTWFPILPNLERLERSRTAPGSHMGHQAVLEDSPNTRKRG